MQGWEIRSFDVQIKKGGKDSAGGGACYVLK